LDGIPIEIAASEPEPEPEIRPAAAATPAPVMPEPVVPAPVAPVVVPESPAASVPSEPQPIEEVPLPAGEPSAPLRTVDVLDEAARARAEAILEASLVDTVPMSREEVQDRVAAQAPAPAPAPVLAPAPTAPAPAPAPAAAPAPAPAPPAIVERPLPPRAPANEDDLTTELAASPKLPDWVSVEDEEDLLRTTVQMSVFEEELDLRDDGR
jgi:hypothetical protein